MRKLTSVKPGPSGTRTALSGDPAAISSGLLAMAGEAYESNRLQQADALCRQLLATHPQCSDAVYLRGLIAYRARRYDVAAAFFAHAVRDAPHYADGYVSLGNALRELGRTENALSRYLHAIRLDPRHRDAHYNLANMLKRLGRLDTALHHYQLLVSYHPRFMLGHNNMGNTLSKLGRYGQAINAYQQALALEPDYAPAHHNLGISRQRLGDLEGAVAAYRQAISLSPDLAAAHANLGTALRALRQLPQAQAHYERAIALAPGMVEAHGNLAALLERRNRLEDAIAAVEEGLAVAPLDAGCRFTRALILRRGGQFDAAMAILEELDGSQMPEEFIVRRHFEMGKILEQRGDYDAAFDAFAAGNERQRYSTAASRVDKHRFLQRIENMQALVAALNPADIGTDGPGVENSPIFLIGFPRSGTTLLDQILDSHPALQVLEEQHLLSRIARELESRYGDYPQALRSLGARESEQLRALYWQDVARHITLAPECQLVDKLPLNIEHVPLAQRLFPNARYLFAKRHPGDVVLSNFFQYYQLNDAMVNFLSLEECVTAYLGVMNLWRACRDRLPLRVQGVCYESLVTDFECETRAMTNFLGLQWSENLAAFHHSARQRDVIQTPSYEQVIQPLYRSSVGRWRHYSTRLQPFLEPLGPTFP